MVISPVNPEDILPFEFSTTPSRRMPCPSCSMSSFMVIEVLADNPRLLPIRMLMLSE